MKKIGTIALLAAVVWTLCGCGSAGNKNVEGEALYEPSYAHGFAISDYQGYPLIDIRNPWQGARGVTSQLLLVPEGETPPEGFAGTVARTPLRSVVCMSASYVGFIDALGEVSAVKGVSGGGFITNSEVRAALDAGQAFDVGYDANLNYELIVRLRPDLVMIYGVAGENSAVTGKLAELGVPYIYISDYLEQSPLGKAEWLVAFGEMFGKRELAQQIFGGIRDSYMSTQKLVAENLNENGETQTVPAESVADADRNEMTAPVVMLNAPWRDTWFVPGDRSYIVRLIQDAGGKYACAGEDNERSRPISSEAAFVHMNGSDFWLNPGQVTTLTELISLNPNFRDVPPVVNGRVYNSNKRTTDHGGSDFWESGAVRADVVLKDLVRILHPDLLPEHELYYFRKIE